MRKIQAPDLTLRITIWTCLALAATGIIATDRMSDPDAVGGMDKVASGMTMMHPAGYEGAVWSVPQVVLFGAAVVAAITGAALLGRRIAR